MAYDLFISSTEEDRVVALAACDVLEREGIKCWIAPRDVERGSEWGGDIIGAIEQSRAMLLVFSSYANESPHIVREVNHAVEEKKRIFLFRIENVEPSGTMEYLVKLVHWFDAYEKPSEEYFPPLTADIKRYLEKPTPPARPPDDRLRKPQPRFTLPQWWIWAVAGLLAIVLAIVVWRFLNSSVPIIDGASPTPTPIGFVSPPVESSSVATAGQSVNPGNIVTTGVTPAPTPTNVPSPVPDATEAAIAKATLILGDSKRNEILARDTIQSLGPLINRSIDQERRIVDILTAYIRKNAAWRGGTDREPKPVPDDIQAAITLLARRKWGYDQGEPRLDLSYTDLRGIDFKEGDFAGVKLVNAHLDRADLRNASFRCADLTGAYVKGVDANTRIDFDGAATSSLREMNPAEMGPALSKKRDVKCSP